VDAARTVIVNFAVETTIVAHGMATATLVRAVIVLVIVTMTIMVAAITGVVILRIRIGIARAMMTDTESMEGNLSNPLNSSTSRDSMVPFRHRLLLAKVCRP
jgi:hypothetical protein